MTELAEGNGEVATDRMESLIQLSVTTVSAMVTLPLSMDEAADGRRKVRCLNDNGSVAVCSQVCLCSLYSDRCLKCCLNCTQIYVILCNL